MQVLVLTIDLSGTKLLINQHRLIIMVSREWRDSGHHLETPVSYKMS